MYIFWDQTLLYRYLRKYDFFLLQNYKITDRPILVGAIDHKKSPLFSIRTIMQLPELRENGRRFYDPSDITHLLLYHPAFEMSKLLLLLVTDRVPGISRKMGLRQVEQGFSFFLFIFLLNFWHYIWWSFKVEHPKDTDECVKKF